MKKFRQLNLVTLGWFRQDIMFEARPCLKRENRMVHMHVMVKALLTSCSKSKVQKQE